MRWILIRSENKRCCRRRTPMHQSPMATPVFTSSYTIRHTAATNTQRRYADALRLQQCTYRSKVISCSVLGITVYCDEEIIHKNCCLTLLIFLNSLCVFCSNPFSCTFNIESWLSIWLLKCNYIHKNIYYTILKCNYMQTRHLLVLGSRFNPKL